MAVLSFLLLSVLMGLLATVYATKCSVDYAWVFECDATITYVHMSTLAVVPTASPRMISAFQASAYHEGCNDQAILFTTSLDMGKTWAPATVAIQPKPYAVWGPVLHWEESTARLWLFYSRSGSEQARIESNCPKNVGQSYPGGSIEVVTSMDYGATWDSPRILLKFTDRGNISKVSANLLAFAPDGTWILPFWQEGHTKYDTGIACAGVLLSFDQGATWQPYGCLHNNYTWLIENSVMQVPGQALLLQVFRTTAGYIYQSFSADNGATWSTPNATALENPNAKVCMTGSGKNVFVAFNPSKTERNPMALASLLGETTWDEFCILDESQHVTFAYPTPIVFNNSIYTTYSADTSKGIKLAVTAVPS